jgi:hypothetical protein
MDYCPTADFLEDTLIIDRAEGLYIGDSEGRLDFESIGGGGSEAVEPALKFVRQYHKQSGSPGKFKVISRNHSDHGGTFAGNGSQKLRFDPQLSGFLKVFAATRYRDHFASSEGANRSGQSFEDVMIQVDPDAVAGILEPIGNRDGIITPAGEFFRILRDIYDPDNIRLIFDELITGFAKTGRMFASQPFGATPDIICIGKNIFLRRHSAGRHDGARNYVRGLLRTKRQQCEGRARTHLREQTAGCLRRTRRDRRDRRKKSLREDRTHRRVSRCASRLPEQPGNRSQDSRQGNSSRIRIHPAQTGLALQKTTFTNGINLRIAPSWFAVAPPLIPEKSDIEEMCARIEKSLKDSLDVARI